MKKILFTILTLFTVLNFCPQCYAESDNIVLLTKIGFFEKNQTSTAKPCDEIKKALSSHLKYTNSYDLEALNSLYADNYVNADGFNKETYFDLIKKTWESYRDIKYTIDIKNIQVNGDMAFVELDEYAIGTTGPKSGLLEEKGVLKSNASCVYYYEKINNEWKITSDHITHEKIYLTYGEAQYANVKLTSPSQISSNKPYTATLEIDAPPDTLVIASIGKENITYPQAVADEVFRKFPENNCLERMFISNDKNINEYTVASYGMTKAEIKKGTQIKIYITGLGFVMSRVNVVPANNFVKVEANEKKQ